jgi:Tfp pilus assembly protein PilF
MPRYMSFPRISTTLLLAATLIIGSSAAIAGNEQKDSPPPILVFPGAEPVKIQKDAPVAAQVDEEDKVAPGQYPEVDNTGTDSTEQAEEQTSEQQTLANLEQREAAENAIAVANQAAASEHYFLGAHYFGKWDLNLAEVELDQAVRYEPNLRAAHRDLCLLSLAKLNILRSIAEFMMVTGLGEAVPYNAKEIKELDLRAKNLHYNKALEWANKQNWNEAISELQWAVKYAPNDPSVHHSLAFAYAAQGDFANAEAEYARTFEANPKDGSAHADYADLLASKGQLDQAQMQMQKAVNLTPKAAAYHVDLGWLAEARNDIATATNEFQQAVKLSPKHAGLWEHYGRLLEKSGKTGEAEAAYKEALSLDPDFADAQRNLNRLKTQRQDQQPKPQQATNVKESA